jgi:hypothetical protein
MSNAQTALKHEEETAMAYATAHLEFASFEDTAARQAGYRGFLRRIYDAIHASRQRQADRDIAAYIERSGGRLTDSMERELMERVSTATFGEPRC